jgi:Xaa-Pro aminopeptidase
MRADRLFETLDQGASESCLLTNLADIRWLTGFSGSHAWLVVHNHSMHLLTDGRYVDQAQAEIFQHQAEVEIVECRTQSAMLTAVASLTSGASFVQFQDAQVSYQLFQSLSNEIKATLVPLHGSIKFLRRFKDEAEIELIEDACRIADQALQKCRPLLSEGLTESDIRDELDYTMRKLGADGPSYDTIVATGPTNAARPHHGQN